MLSLAQSALHSAQWKAKKWNDCIPHKKPAKLHHTRQRAGRLPASTNLQFQERVKQTTWEQQWFISWQTPMITVATRCHFFCRYLGRRQTEMRRNMIELRQWMESAIKGKLPVSIKTHASISTHTALHFDVLAHNFPLRNLPLTKTCCNARSKNAILETKFTFLSVPLLSLNMQMLS